ncbi:MAG: OHCU decarboxylase, partial [Paracoccaceae bacterium]
RPSRMDKASFAERFGRVFEHSHWVAERAHALEMGPAHDTAQGIHALLVQIFRRASKEERMNVLIAHPDLAGKLAAARKLTGDSTDEQASAGLDALTEEERRTFTDLNDRYVAKFGFPFIIAVRDHSKASILQAFQQRLENQKEQEFSEACRQVERIAELRLHAMEI